jgi:hypothetical protein
MPTVKYNPKATITPSGGKPPALPPKGAGTNVHK